MTTRDRNRALITARATAPARFPGLSRPTTGNRAVDSWISDVSRTLEVMLGSRGPYDALVSRRDLDDRLQELGVVTQAVSATTPKGGVIVAGPNGSSQVMGFNQFAEELRSSQLYADLTRSISDAARFDGMPDRVKQILLAELAPITGQVYSAIRRFDESIAQQGRAFSASVEELSSAVQSAAAGVRQVKFTSTSENRATAGLVTTITARLDDFDGGGATVEETMTAVADRVTGTEAQYTIKVATNGAMAGFGLASTTSVSGNATSHAIIMADKFAVVGTGDTLSGSGTTVSPYTPPANRVPFGIDTTNNTVYINGNVRIANLGPRIDSAVKRIELSANTDSFILDGRGGASPSSVTITCTLHNGLTGTVTWSVTNGTATLTSTSNSGATLTFANLTTDTATIQASITDTSVTYTHTITIKKALDGVRGSVAGTGLFYGISSGSWSDAKANRVISNIINGESLTTDLASTSLNSIGDSVTLSNGSSYSATKYWNGAAWTAPGTIINGDLLVDGTISAGKMNVSTLSAITADLGSVTAGTIGASVAIDVNGTGGISFKNGATAVYKVKLDASSNLVLQGQVANKSVKLYGPGGGGLSVDDFTTANQTDLAAYTPNGTKGAVISVNSSTNAVELSTVMNGKLYLTSFGSLNNIVFSAGGFEFNNALLSIKDHITVDENAKYQYSTDGGSTWNDITLRRHEW